MGFSHELNIYIDVDGVIVIGGSKLSAGATELIKYIADNFTVYWLTTHCMHGDPEHSVDYVNRASDEDLSPWLKKFKPTVWSLKKTDAIDFSQPFLWLDDDLFTAEKIVLEENNAENRFVRVNLKENNHRIREILETLKAYDDTKLPI